MWPVSAFRYSSATERGAGFLPSRRSFALPSGDLDIAMKPCCAWLTLGMILFPISNTKPDIVGYIKLLRRLTECDPMQIVHLLHLRGVAGNVCLRIERIVLQKLDAFHRLLARDDRSVW